MRRDRIRKTERLTTARLEKLVGGLSTPSKMPGYGWSIPAEFCITGRALRQRKGTVCSRCYASKGRYVFPKVQKAMRRRLTAYRRAPHLWVQRMAELLNHRAENHSFFRWFDSGDLQSVAMMEHIAEVARLTPTVWHWLPTREWGLVKDFLDTGAAIPVNLIVRVSAAYVGDAIPIPPSFEGVRTSSVSAHAGFQCPARANGNQCGECRACWSRNVVNVDYKDH